MITDEKALQHRFTITRFRDGDTVEGFLECRHCKATHRECVRILKIESWEPKGVDSARARDTAQQLTERFRGITGTLTSNSLRRDRHGRLLADIIIGDTAISLLIVNLRLAWWGVGEPDPGIVTFPE